AMLTLARLKVRNAIPGLMRLLTRPETEEKTKKQALTTLVGITGIPFRSAEKALTWWDEAGKVEFEQITQAAKRESDEADESGGVKRAPLIKDKAGPKLEPPGES